MSDSWFASRFRILTTLGYMAGLGAVLLIVRLLLGERATDAPLWVGVALILPALVYAYLLPIWHWKARYVGSHSDLWGALLVVEVSGWLKLVYWFRHLIPDYVSSGRYGHQGEGSAGERVRSGNVSVNA